MCIRDRDEIDHALDRGSGVEGGKGRIYEYFTADHTGKEKAAFLKDCLLYTSRCV